MIKKNQRALDICIISIGALSSSTRPAMIIPQFLIRATTMTILKTAYVLLKSHLACLSKLLLILPVFTCSTPDVLGRPGLRYDHRRSADPDIDTLRSRLETIFLQKKVDARAAADLPLMRADGSWPDIDYQDRTAGAWKAAKHWERILMIAHLIKQGGMKTADRTRLLDQTTRAIRYWQSIHPVNRNYWWNAIGIPLRIGETLILLQQYLPKALVSEMSTMMMTGIIADHYEYYGMATGQNLIWLARIHLMIGLLKSDESILKRAFGVIYDELKVSNDDGIQFDYSFHQHGPQLYSGGYGIGFTQELAELISYSHGTSYQFPADRIMLYLAFLLDGQQWMFYREMMDPNTYGREISRLDPENNRTKAMIRVCMMLLNLDIPRKTEIRNFLNRLQSGRPALTGSRYFWDSDYMVHQGGAYYSGLKMFSSRVTGSESGNSENLQAYYLGRGVNLTMRSGREYAGIYPVWDWKQLPGSLAAQKAIDTPLFIWGVGGKGVSAFTGGVTDSVSGLAATDYQWSGVSAKRAWFFLPGYVITLGADINSTSAYPLYQTINQCWSSGKVIGSENGQTKELNGADTRSSRENIRWILQDSVGYYFPNGSPLHIRNDFQQGTWQSINADLSDSVISGKVFKAWLDFGKESRKKSFVYYTIPGMSEASMRKFVPDFKVISNTGKLQAVSGCDGGLMMAVFYEPGQLKMAGGLTIKSTVPILLIMRTNNKSYELHVASPYNKPVKGQLMINQKLSCSTCKTLPQRKTTLIMLNEDQGDKNGRTARLTMYKINHKGKGADKIPIH